MPVIRQQLEIKGRANFSQITKEADRTSSAFRKSAQATKQMEGAQRRMAAQARRTAAAFTTLRSSILSFAGPLVLLYAVKNTIQLGDEMAKTARRVGVTTDQLQGFQFAAASLNVPIGKIEGALTRLQKELGNLNLVSSEFRTVLQEINPELLEQLENVDNTTDAYALVEKAIRNATDRTEALAIASGAFGARGGAALLQIINEGGGSVDGFTQRLRELGGVISGDVLTNMEDLNQAITDFSKFVVAGFAEAISGAYNFAKQLGEIVFPALGVSFGDDGATALARAAVSDAQQALDEAEAAGPRSTTITPGSKGAGVPETTPAYYDRLAELGDVLLAAQVRLEGRLKTQSQADRDPPKLFDDDADDQIVTSSTAASAAIQQRSTDYSKLSFQLDVLRRETQEAEAANTALNIAVEKAADLARMKLDIELDRLEEVKQGELALAELSRTRVLREERIEELLDKQKDLIKEQAREAQRLGQVISRDIVGGLRSGVSASEILGSTLNNVLDSLLQKLITAPLANAIEGFAGNVLGSLVGGFFGGGAASPSFGSINPGNISARPIGAASGGLVRVGERGPELLSLPDGSSIFPTNTGTSSAPNITINVSGVQDPTIVRREIERLTPSLSAAAVAAVSQQAGRPGRARQALT